MSREENLSSEGYRLICSLVDLQKLKKKRVTIDERVVVLFYVKGKVYAIDHFCYRKYLLDEMIVVMYLKRVANIIREERIGHLMKVFIKLSKILVRLLLP